MADSRSRLTAACGLTLLTATGCLTSLDIGDMTPVENQDSIIRKDVVIEAAVLPSGQRSQLSVEDYTLPTGDGTVEVHIPWSQTQGPVARYASINFPEAEFGAGVEKVDVTAFHYNKCRLQAYDRAGTPLASADHTAGQKVHQTMTLTGGRIARIEIVGAEIGLVEIEFEK